MPKRKTHDEYVSQVNTVAPHVLVLGKYNGNRTPITHYCSKHNVQWDVSPFNFLQHSNGCKSCQKDALDNYNKNRRKTHEQFLTELYDLNIEATPLNEYNGCHNKISFMCKNGHVWSSTPHDVLSGCGCPYCAGSRTLDGFNDLWTTDPDVASMLFDSSVGHEISRGSHREVEWVCSTCGKHKLSSPKQVVTYGLACAFCSDKISYPNKFIVSLLSQAGVQLLIPEWSPDWISPLRYDVYFLYNNKEYVVEMDGGIGHGLLDFSTGGVDTDGLSRDHIKDQRAKIHNIDVIRIDCDYRDIKQRLNYIKQSIIKSQLNEILDLDNIDWNICNKNATKSLHMDAVKQYNNGYSINEIATNLNVSYNTVYNWLKRMSVEGLCSYEPALGRPKKITQQNTQ